MKIEIDNIQYQRLDALSQSINKDVSQMIKDALDSYIKETEEKLTAIDPESRLDFNEFWEGVDID